MRVLAARRPEVLFLASLLVLAVTLIARTVLDRPQQSLAIDTSAPASPPVSIGAEQTIGRLQDRIRANPEDTFAYAQLGLAFLQRVRETADPSLYTRADQAL